jgi:hypothetical protein
MESSPSNPGWRVQLAVHRAVRRDAGRLSRALAEGRDTSHEALGAYWSAARFQLHEHHVLEDAVIWPLMGERLHPRVDELLQRNVREHKDMAAAMDGFDAALAEDAIEARVALRQLEMAIETHLSHEEADVLPLIPEAFTPEDIGHFSEEAAKTNPGPAFLPWLLDGAPDDDIAFFTGAMPARC